MLNENIAFIFKIAEQSVTLTELKNLGIEIFEKSKSISFNLKFSKQLKEEIDISLKNKDVSIALEEYISDSNLLEDLIKDFNKTFNKKYSSKQMFVERVYDDFFKFKPHINEYKDDAITKSTVTGILEDMYNQINENKNTLKDSELKKFLNIFYQILESNKSDTEKHLSENKFSIGSHNLPGAEEIYGRDGEIHEIIKKICVPSKKILFVTGMGGIGKSAIVRNVLEKKEVKERFNKILFLNFTSDLISLINDKEELDIKNFNYNITPEIPETAKDLFIRRLSALKEATDSNTLIVVDNFDVDICREFKSFISGPYSIIFTSRNRHDQFKDWRIEIEGIKDPEKLFKIFYNNCEKADSENQETHKYVKELIEFVRGHVLTVILIARQINENEVTVKEMFEALKDKGFNNKYDVKYFINQSDEERSMLEHILHILLRAESSFGKKEILVLVNLALIQPKGISQSKFKELIKATDVDNIIYKLIRNGWVQRQFINGSSIISLHPVINEIITVHLKPEAIKSKCYNLIDEYGGRIKIIGGRSREEFDSFLNECMFADRKLKGDTTDIVMDLRMFIWTAYSSFSNTDVINYGEDLIEEYQEYFDKNLGIKMRVYADHAFNYFRIIDDDIKAKKYLDIALETSKQVTGFKPDKGRVYNIYGDLIYKNNREGSIKWREDALEIWKEIKHEYPIEYSIALLNMAWCWHYKKDYVKACSLGEEALEYRLPEEYTTEGFWDIKENLQAYSTTYIAKAYSDLGRFYSCLKDMDMFNKSRQNLNISLKMYKYIFGENHKDVGRTHEGIGLSYYMQGENKEALKEFDAAEDIFKRNPSKANMGTIKFYKARAQYKLGNIVGALDEAKKSYELRKEFLDEDSFAVKEVEELLNKLNEVQNVHK